ncbi:hypothetical protein NL676_033846 [Syzygium grande]|nr:hypothetical protein NL676_033846 [Syzygium grande]
MLPRSIAELIRARCDISIATDGTVGALQQSVGAFSGSFYLMPDMKFGPQKTEILCIRCLEPLTKGDGSIKSTLVASSDGSFSHFRMPRFAANVIPNHSRRWPAARSEARVAAAAIRASICDALAPNPMMLKADQRYQPQSEDVAGLLCRGTTERLESQGSSTGEGRFLSAPSGRQATMDGVPAVDSCYGSPSKPAQIRRFCTFGGANAGLGGAESPRRFALIGIVHLLYLTSPVESYVRPVGDRRRSRDLSLGRLGSCDLGRPSLGAT